jgi:hypothetical protein
MFEVDENFNDCWIDEVNLQEGEWIIDSLLCPQLTLLSGQPKMGKSLLAGHLATSLLYHESILGKPISQKIQTVGWMGFDGGWKPEVANRWRLQNAGRMKLYEMRRCNPGQWLRLGEKLVQDNVGLLVIDHLYGLSGALDLNDAAQAAEAMMCIRPIYETFGIPVLLISQSTKSHWGNGKAAHSNRILGEARCLLQLHGKAKNGRRTLKVEANSYGDESLQIQLSPNECTLLDGRVSNGAPDRTSPDTARRLLSEGNPLELKTVSGAGRELVRLSISANADAGRSMANRFIKQGLLRYSPESGITAGESLIV